VNDYLNFIVFLT